MTTLNLIHADESEIDYKIINYPDGQKELKLLTKLNHKDFIKIICRVRNSDELFILLQAIDIFKRHELSVYIDIKYLFTAHTDIIFSFNRPQSLKIVANILMKAIDYDLNNTITILDVHNDAYLKHNFICLKPPVIPVPANSVVFYPDEGAEKRYAYLKLNNTTIYGEKTRNVDTGDIIKYELFRSNPDTENYKSEDIIVFDDLCDGGGTFKLIYEKLYPSNPNSIVLCVTHAIQKKALLELANLYTYIYITNSYTDWENESLPKNIIITNVTYE